MGAVNDHTGETVVQFQPRKRRQEMAQRLSALVHTPHRNDLCGLGPCHHPSGRGGGSGGASRRRTPGLALRANVEPLAPSHGEVVAAFPAGSDPLRVLSDHAGPADGCSAGFRALQPVPGENLIRDRLSCRESSVTVLSS